MNKQIKNLAKAAERIIRAVKDKEKIILYGDTDLDGVSSVIILQECIKTLGGKVSALYFPDREAEGWGLSEAGLNSLKDKLPALLVVVDCGISNFNEAKLAKKLGFGLIIIDHHEVLDKLPEADIVVDPKQKGDEYPFKLFASVGIIFKLAELILKEKMTASFKKSFLELVAIATLADSMPKEEENKIFIEDGMSYLENSWRPGIRAVLAAEPIKALSGLNQKISKVISILNVRDVKNSLPASFRLFVSPSLKSAQEIVRELIIKSKIRKEKIEEILMEVESRIAKRTEPIIFEGGNDFELTLIGSVASIICQKYLKPTFLYKKMAEESQGSVRSPADADSVALMKKCSKYPLSYGGHPRASGFRIKNENLENFKSCLIKNLVPTQSG